MITRILVGRAITSKTAEKFLAAVLGLRNQEEVNNSKNSETDYLRVRASKVNTRPQVTESFKCTERGDNSSSKKRFLQNLLVFTRRKLLPRNLNYQSSCGS